MSRQASLGRGNVAVGKDGSLAAKSFSELLQQGFKARGAALIRVEKSNIFVQLEIAAPGSTPPPPPNI